MPKKNLIWCEVKCLRCCRVANTSGWYSPERIKKLKQETKNWKEDGDYGILCPDCYEEVITKRKLGINYD